MDSDNIFKVMMGLMTTFIGWCFYGLQRNTAKHERTETKLNDHERQISVIDAQLKHILDKLNDVVELGVDLKASNRTILRALASNIKK
jgi:hypothetical protein